jgi:hypothetical protein
MQSPADDSPSLENRAIEAVLGYGSLVHPEALESEFGHLDPAFVPVRLEGYRRVCNNRSSWRDPERAVLNVERDPERWCNGILVAFRGTRPDGYEERERGYHFERLSPTRLEPYVPAHGSVLDDVDRVAVPIGDRVERDIDPLLEYVERCLEGAKRWSERLEETADALDDGFLAEFVRTTELADGTPLAACLERNRESIDVPRAADRDGASTESGAGDRRTDRP